MQLSALLPWRSVFVNGKRGTMAVDEITQQDRLVAHEEVQASVIADVRRGVGMRETGKR
jgi:hypothetical protein